MTRRSLLSVLFAFLLMFGQQQAIVHGYIHTSEGYQQSSHHGKSTHHSEICSKCISISGLGAAVGSNTSHLYVAPSQFEFYTALAKAIIAKRFFSYHSRAPPILA